MKKDIFLIFLFFQLFSCLAVVKNNDSFGRKNLIEVGPTCVNLFNQNGFLFVHPLANFYLSYTRVLTRRHFLIKVDYHTYSRGYLKQTEQFGKAVSTSFQLARFSVGKVWQYHQWRFSPYVSFDNRWGFGDEVLMNPYPSEPSYAVSHYKSFGAGIGGSVNYIIRKRFTLGIESHFDYFFQKSNLTYGNKNLQNETFYQPNRIGLIGHFKLGLLF